MPDKPPTKIGSVQNIQGSDIIVKLDSDLAGLSPIYRGELREIGQVGSFVRIPQGLVDLIGAVSKVKVSEQSETGHENLANQTDNWLLEIDLIGQIDQSSESFQRGVGTYPELGDPVHFATSVELESIFPKPNEQQVRFGFLSTDQKVPITLDAKSLVVKHSALVGSTGSGKTSAVASLLQNLVRQGWENSNILVIDPHGEYKNALGDIASVLSVLPDEENQLKVPYWVLPPEDILRIFVGGSGGNHSFKKRFGELVVQARQSFADSASWLDDINSSSISEETPIPFNIREIWHQIDYENNETRTKKGDPETVCDVKEGDPEELEPAQFEPYGTAGSPPNQGPRYGSFGDGPDRLRLGLLDPRLKFFQQSVNNSDGDDPLVDILKEWLGDEQPISVLDFSGVPDRAAESAIGVVLDIIFQVAIRSGGSDSGIGRPSPVLVVLEEAHRYLGSDAIEFAQISANQIAREGRKYGVGLLAVTQRPTELPDTTLAQCGTIISLRLTNSGDQNTIKSAMPDNTTGVAEALPSLRTHEAIISGEAVTLPARAFLDNPDPWPEAEDPSLEPWRSDPESPSVGEALKEWRDLYN